MIRENEKRVNGTNWQEKKERKRELRSRREELNEELKVIVEQIRRAEGANRSKTFLEKKQARIRTELNAIRQELDNLTGGRVGGSAKVERTPEEM